MPSIATPQPWTPPLPGCSESFSRTVAALPEHLRDQAVERVAITTVQGVSQAYAEELALRQVGAWEMEQEGLW